jgi:Protein of unknown function (DUF1559)
MMAKSFTVPCPSCEADVLVKNDSLIGKKIDCTKCKYRFKVPDPNRGDADDASTAEIPAAKGKKPNSKMLIGVGAGIAALALLAGVGYFVFSGDDPKPKSPTVQRPPTPTPVVPQPQPMADPMGDGNPMTPMPMVPEGDPVIAPPVAIAPPPNFNSGNTTPAAPKVEIPLPVPAGQMKDPTNLLPGKTQAVLQINMQRLQQTPIYSSFFDRQTLDFFRNSMHFDATDITQIVLALVGADREPFTVIRTKTPVHSLNSLYDKMQLTTGKLSPIKNRPYAVIKPNSNPFVTAVSRALSTESLMGQAGIPITNDDKKRWAEKDLAICIYDSQTIIIAETNWLESFLDDLGENGYPTFLSELTPQAAPAAPAAAPMGGATPMGSTPMGPMGSTPMGSTPMGPGGSPMSGAPMRTPPMGGTTPMGPMGGTTPMGPMGPMGGTAAPAAPRPAPRLFTSIPNFRTIKPELKRMLNRLEEDDKNPAGLLYADILDKRVYNRDFQSIYAVAGLVVGVIVEHTQTFGAAIKNIQKEKFAAELIFEFVSAEDAKTTANERLDGLLRTLASLIARPLGTSIAVTNTAGGGQNRSNGPGDTEGLAGSVSPGIGGSTPPMGEFRAAGRNAGGTGGGGGGSQQQPPGSTPMGGSPDGSGGNFTPIPQRKENASFIEIDVADTFVSVETEIYWSADAYAKIIQPGVASGAAQLKGRMAVLSGATKQHDLAGPVKKLLDEKQMVPPTTMARAANIERFGLPYPPDHRVSFMADLLPYLGRGGLRQSIQEKRLPWYAKEHEAAGTTWISEFLVPHYPQSSWRATHPLGEDRSYGGTNYVAMSGLGLDSARYDPSNPAHAKKVGMTGYDWGSKFPEVTDGLSNTIYMIQVPPTHSRPWIAGGGATVQGADENLPNPVEDFVDPLGAKRGTHILMGDGSVRFVPATIDPAVFKALVTRAGGEKIDDLNKHAPLVGGPKTTETEIKGSVNNPFRPKPKGEEPKKEEPKK